MSASYLYRLWGPRGAARFINYVARHQLKKHIPEWQQRFIDAGVSHDYTGALLGSCVLVFSGPLNEEEKQLVASEIQREVFPDASWELQLTPFSPILEPDPVANLAENDYLYNTIRELDGAVWTVVFRTGFTSDLPINVLPPPEFFPLMNYMRSFGFWSSGAISNVFIGKPILNEAELQRFYDGLPECFSRLSDVSEQTMLIFESSLADVHQFVLP